MSIFNEADPNELSACCKAREITMPKYNCKCGEKDPDKFYHFKTGTRKGRPYSQCKRCKINYNTSPQRKAIRKINSKRYYSLHREIIQHKEKLRYWLNCTRRREISREYYKTHRNYFKTKLRGYRQQNPEYYNMYRYFNKYGISIHDVPLDIRDTYITLNTLKHIIKERIKRENNERHTSNERAA